MKTVTVLMSTYNGEKYLSEQIESLLLQEGVYVSIFVRDDGSTDATKTMLDEYEKKGVLTWYTGENLKPARSFLNLVENTQKSDYYAFCDQDDVWNIDKLKRAVDALEQIEQEGKPCLYCSNYQLVDSKLNILPENGHVSTTSFGAALVASNCTGCTTVFNNALLKILRMAKPDIIVMHDDWAHKVCLAVGGEVIYDEYKSLKYRQHGNNADGGIHSFSDKVFQIIKRIKTKERIRSLQIGEIIKCYSNLLTEENYTLAKRVYLAEKEKLIDRLFLAFDKRLQTGYAKLDSGFRVAIIMRYF